MNAVFLSHINALVAGGGGQQQCTREYRDLLRAAGFDLSDVGFDTDRSPRTRVLRKLRPAAYANLIPETYLAEVVAAVSRANPGFVFCNLHDFVPWGPRLRAALPARTKLVLLSHGLASVDEIHVARIARSGIGAAHLPQVTDARIGQMLHAESLGLPAFDHVVCLAEFEVGICRWLGARSVSWLPRILSANDALEWRPQGDRVGIVGTLDHPPNLEGAELFCAALAAAGPGRLRVRVVTHSRAVAASLSERFAFVDDLGPLLAPGDLQAEAATWSAFMHPIFCHAMGCSTKVATGLGWGLPVLTTNEGLRGYIWKEGSLRVSVTPEDLARAALESLDRERSAVLRKETMNAVRTAPKLADIANQLLRDLQLGTIESMHISNAGHL